MTTHETPEHRDREAYRISQNPWVAEQLLDMLRNLGLAEPLRRAVAATDWTDEEILETAKGWMPEEILEIAEALAKAVTELLEGPILAERLSPTPLQYEDFL